MAVTAAKASPGSAVRAANDDPLLRYQWHISNRGQQVIGDIRPVAGVDMDVEILHELGLWGRGVRVGVVDDGLELGHEDLADNIIRTAHTTSRPGRMTSPPPIRLRHMAPLLRASPPPLAGMAAVAAG